MNQEDKYFRPVDFVIFGVVLLFSALIGVYFAYKDRKRQSTDNYYYGDRAVSPIAVAMSLSVSYVSAITVIGTPVEVYLYGIVFIWSIAAWILACFFSGVYYLPLIYRLKLSTINQVKQFYTLPELKDPGFVGVVSLQYLELRFHKVIRKAVSFMVVIQLILYMGITIYVPSLALSAVTPLRLGWTIFLTSAICTFYTSIGGLKAVIWTDVMQGIIMLCGSLSVFIRAVEMVGGFSEMMEAANRGGRDNFIVTNPDLRVRSTIWTILLGNSLYWCRVMCCEQVVAQRFLSCKSIKNARIALLLAIAPVILFFTIALFNGIAMYAYFEGCDPVESGMISKSDQSIPLLAVEIFQSSPGVAGLFVSAAYSGTLSTVSSGINALAALTLMDFIMPRWPRTKLKKQMILSKILSVIYGSLVMGLAYVISMLKSNAIEITFVLTGFIGGPLLGVFTMGIFMPWINYKGALVGTVCGWMFTAWLGIVSIVVEPLEGTRNKLPLSVDTCNFTKSEITSPSNSELNLFTTYIYSGDMQEHAFLQSTSVPIAPDQRPLIYDTLYSLSPFLYVTGGFVVSIAIGNIVSLLTGCSKPSKANPELFVPIFDNKILPKKIRKFFRFGVPKLSTLEKKQQSSDEANEKLVLEDNLLFPEEKNQIAPKNI